MERRHATAERQRDRQHSDQSRARQAHCLHQGLTNAQAVSAALYHSYAAAMFVVSFFARFQLHRWEFHYMPGGVFSLKRNCFAFPTRQPDNDGWTIEASLPSLIDFPAQAMATPCQPADYYETLGVQRAVSDADIKKA